ncbi:MAG: Clp protease N-terminal domain-containing protein, partial [Bacteroidota bacterium]
MNLNKFTIKAQEAVQQAQQLAFDEKNPAIEPVHILKALLSTDEDVIPYLLKKSQANLSLIQSRMNDLIKRLARTEGGDIYLSNSASQALMRAQSSIRDFKDEFVSVEHILLGLLNGKDDTARLLKDAGLSEGTLKQAILELRKGSTIDSQSADTTFNALNKYAINLNERAESGKLDPVIGRDEEIRRVLHILTRRT